MAAKQIYEEDLRTRIEFAWDSSTEPRVLTLLADDPNEVVRKFVAENPNTPAEIVEKLINNLERNIKMDEASARFFVNPPAKNKDSIYAEAVKRAYGDMSRHTLHYSSPRYKGQTRIANEARKALQDAIATNLMAMEDSIFMVASQEAYDAIHLEMCNVVSEVFTSADSTGEIPIVATSQDAEASERKNTFSMGQAQKLVNMVWKYVYLFYQYFNAKTGSDYENELASFNRIIRFLHAPVDNFVIIAATDSNSNYYLECDAPKYPWSQLYYCEYQDFQNAIRAKLNENNQNPFTWELENYPFK